VKHVQPLPGYLDDVAILDQEYQKFHGKALNDNEARKQFQLAAELASRGEYNGAVLILEPLSKQAALPVVFNDIGILYAQLNDRARAIRGFRDALARDIDYRPVRLNLDRLKGLTTNAADPVTTEIEPNNNHQLANVIGVDKPVEGEISALDNDIDVFRVTSPPAPRDLLLITLQNHSKTLDPHLTLYDEEGAILPWGKEVSHPGESLAVYIAPKPNTTMFLHVFGSGSTSGAYTLTVKSTKAFDPNEPNDDIYSARKITVGSEVDANIMDADDTDFYSFVSPRNGTVTVDVRPNATMVPALSTFTPDMRSSGFGPDVRTPGAPLHHTIAVEQGATYYIQVWSQARSSGPYTLVIH